MAVTTAYIYKVLPSALWRAARGAGQLTGAAIDLQDGYIHFSTAAQLAETLRKHFDGQRDLVLLTVAVEDVGDALRWEPSRGGALFPHLYGALPVSAVRSAVALATASDGIAAAADLATDPVPASEDGSWGRPGQ